jgi:hypothetical protein
MRGALPGLNYVVVDANQLLVDMTIKGLVAEYRASGQRIALPWVHLYEQTKSGSAAWFAKVHEYLRAEPQAVMLANPSFVLNTIERRTGRPVRSMKWIDSRPNTRVIRSLLRSPQPNADISDFRREAQTMFGIVHKPGWREILVDSVKLDTEAEAKALRKALAAKDRQPLREAVVEYCRLGRLRRALEQLLRVNGISWRRARLLVRYPSMSALTIIAHIWLGLYWKTMTPKKEPEANPACDVEAVLVALYGKRLVSADRVALALDADMRLIARAMWT